MSTLTPNNNDVLSPHNLCAIVQLCSPTTVSKYLRCCSKGMDAAVEQAVLNYNAFPWRYICDGEEEDGRRCFVPVAKNPLSVSSSPHRIIPPSGEADRATLQVNIAEASNNNIAHYEVQRIITPSTSTPSTTTSGEGRYICNMILLTDWHFTITSSVKVSKVPDGTRDASSSSSSTATCANTEEFERLRVDRSLPSAVGFATRARTACILPILHRPTDMDQVLLINLQVARHALERIAQDMLASEPIDLTTYCLTTVLGGQESEVETVRFVNDVCRVETTERASISLELNPTPTEFNFSLQIQWVNKKALDLSKWATPHHNHNGDGGDYDGGMGSWFRSIEGFDGWAPDVRDYIGPMPVINHEPPSSIYAVTAVGSDFFSNCHYLRSIDVRGLSHVTTLQDRFLASSTIPTISFEGWSALIIIGGQFMSGCHSLKEIDLSPFTNVSSIGTFFLSSCTSLETVTFAPQGVDVETCKDASLLGLGLLLELPQAFIRGCSSLLYLSMRPFANVTHIHPSFLRECSSLRSIDLSPLVSLRGVGRFFLGECSSLKEIDLGVLHRIPFVPEGLLQSCTSLGTIPNGVVDISIVFKPFVAASVIQPHCLQLCTSIMAISTVGLGNITNIGSNFLHGCSKLQTIDLGGLTSVTYIDSSFLAGCEALLTVDFTPLNHGQPIYIGNSFMSECLSLQKVDLKPLSAVSSIGSGFFRNCPNLAKMDLSPIKGVLPKGAFGSDSQGNSLCSIS